MSNDELARELDFERLLALFPKIAMRHLDFGDFRKTCHISGQ